MNASTTASPPRISVVMGVFNAADLLAETIESVLGQDVADFEFIMVNDGSSDSRTGEILGSYERRDARVRVMTQPNGGLTKALIAGCSAARGEYIVRIDAGDAMTPARLRLQKDFLDGHPEVVFVSCWTEYCGPAWEPLMTKREQDTGAEGMAILPPAPAAYLLSGPTHHASVMFRRAAYEAVGGYRWQFYYGQDWDLWYRMAERGRFHIVPQVLYRVRVFPDGISSQHRAKQEAIGKCSLDAFRLRRLKQSETPALECAARIRPVLGPPGRRSLRQQADGWYFIGNQLWQRRDGRCRHYFARSLRFWPWHWRAWAGLLISVLPAGGRLPRRRKMNCIDDNPAATCWPGGACERRAGSERSSCPGDGEVGRTRDDP